MTARDRDIYRRHLLGVTDADLARMFCLGGWQIREILDRQRAAAEGRRLLAKVIPMPTRRSPTHRSE